MKKQTRSEVQPLPAKQLVVRTHTFWLPLFLAASLTALFAFAGGGQGRPLPTTATGFLKRLPSAFVAPVTHLDKMGYYDLARRDSIAQHQRLVIQNNYGRQLGFPDSNVTRIQQKLEALKHAIMPKRTTPILPSPPPPAKTISSPLAPHAPDLARVEQAMRLLRSDATPAADPELRELNTVVERLLILQRSQSDTTKRSAAGQSSNTHAQLQPTHPDFVVLALPDESDTLRVIDTTHTGVAAVTLAPFDSTRIEAVVPDETVLASGGQLRLRLTCDVLVGRQPAHGLQPSPQRIPAGTALYGMATLSGERLQVRIDAIASEGRIFNVNLEVTDEDGLPGIYIPGAPVSEALRESAGQELGTLGTGILSTTLAGQAAGAGMTLARSLIGKKIRPVKVTIPAGYHLLLHLKNAGI